MQASAIRQPTHPLSEQIASDLFGRAVRWPQPTSTDRCGRDY